MTGTHKSKVLVIVGPTASGKTSLSIELGKRFNGEIISADSRQVYRGLDIGTGKVTRAEMQGIHHHLLDVAEPQNVYTVADYVRDGRIAIDSILSREKLPIIVGGTFFYINALLGAVSTPEVPPNVKLREELEKYSNEELFEILKEKDNARAETIDPSNQRRLIRAIEIASALGAVPKTRAVELYNALAIGIHIEKEDLLKNIHTRLVERITAGMIDEVVTLHKNGLSYERMTELGIEYQHISRYLQNKITKDEMCSLIETKSRQYAKRQMTWLKRDKVIQWVRKDESEKIEGLVNGFLIN
ncbi:MAG: tRNA (adenosine(37)-N6)-dimethylallyltransferase MiaA [Candidatus Kaiserbacteria bacterium]|nr:tRNA (adenosine(37)-N6)-dimethylallyltransferase MiaA [Candidatus Kaiserbacteria bacterium]